MMTNGDLYCKIISGGGRDENGNNLPEDVSWGEPIPCLWTTNTHNNNGTYQDGKFTVAAYTVLIELQDFTATCIKLISDRGTNLGEFQIQDIQFLDSVGRVKIMV